MYNITIANNSKLNVKFGRPRTATIMRKDKNDLDEIIDVTLTLAKKQPGDCNNCKAQRINRTLSRVLNRGFEEGSMQIFTTARMFKQRGMMEEAHDVDENDGTNLRWIQEKRRRERDQVQAYHRKGYQMADYV